MTCDDLIAFCDGALDPPRAAEFREHLRCCEACKSGLVEAEQLGARLSTLPVTAYDRAESARLCREAKERARISQVSGGPCFISGHILIAMADQLEAAGRARDAWEEECNAWKRLHDDLADERDKLQAELEAARRDVEVAIQIADDRTCPDERCRCAELDVLIKRYRAARKAGG